MFEYDDDGSSGQDDIDELRSEAKAQKKWDKNAALVDGDPDKEYPDDEGED